MRSVQERKHDVRPNNGSRYLCEGSCRPELCVTVQAAPKCEPCRNLEINLNRYRRFKDFMWPAFEDFSAKGQSERIILYKDRNLFIFGLGRFDMLGRPMPKVSDIQIDTDSME